MDYCFTRDIKATVCCFLPVKHRLRVVSLLDKQWNDAVRHPLVWENVNLECQRLTDSSMRNLAQFLIHEHVCPRSLEWVSLYLACDAWPRLLCLTDICQLDLHHVSNPHVSILEGHLHRFRNLTHLGIDGTWDLISLPVLPSLCSLRVRGHSSAVAGIGHQQSLAELYILVLDGCMRALKSRSPPSQHQLAALDHVFEMPHLTHFRTCDIDDIFLMLPRPNDLILPCMMRFRCPNLISLDTEDAIVEDHHVQCIAQELCHLRKLHMCCGALRGAAMRALGTMISLEDIDMDHSSLIVDADMAPLGQLANLQTLSEYCFTRLTDQWLTHIVSLPHLSYLHLSSHSRDFSIASLCRCVSLRSLSLHLSFNALPDCPLPSSIAASLAAMPHLHSLYISMSPTDQDMSLLLDSLRNLRSLHIAYPLALFSASSLAYLSHLSSLESLSIPLPLSSRSDLSVCIQSLCAVHSLRCVRLDVCHAFSAIGVRFLEKDRTIFEINRSLRAAMSLPRLESVHVL